MLTSILMWEMLIWDKFPWWDVLKNMNKGLVRQVQLEDLLQALNLLHWRHEKVGAAKLCFLLKTCSCCIPTQTQITFWKNPPVISFKKLELYVQMLSNIESKSS